MAREPVPDDLVAFIARNYLKASYSNMILMNHRGVGCEVDKDDLMSIEDDQWITDGVVNFHNVLLSIRKQKLRDGKTWAAMDCKAYTQTNAYGAPLTLGHGLPLLEHDYLAIPVLEAVLSELAKASNPYANMERVDKQLLEADCIILRMRRDLCAHACGDLIRQLEELGIEIPPQDASRVTDEGAVVQERNARLGVERQAPDTYTVEDARVTEMARDVATLKNDVRYLDASVMVMANFVGLRRDEVVVSAATQLLLHGSRVGPGGKAEAGGTKNAPRTPQRPSGSMRRDDSSHEEDGVRNATRVALDSSFAACDPPARMLQNPLLMHGTIPHWMFTRGRQLLGVTVPAAEAWGDTRGHEAVKADQEEDLVSDTEDEDDDEDTCATKCTGVKMEKASSKFDVKILIKKKGKRKQQRLGAYTSIDEAAYAYAAGACVLRPREKIPNTVTLTAAEKALLRGCTKEDLQILVEARKWWRWRSWRNALESVSSNPKRGR
ncbi:unnamed protein product [Closterium sp. Yama58-4]|nr:unnamed protein product [Closterium sp. Yama58-4]